MNKSKIIQELVSSAPTKPGIYQYFDSDKRILYIGKAKNLKNRVSSYFTSDRTKSGRTRLMVSKIADIKYIITESELDALLLENSLIKKHQPRYNVMLKDDKTYPWICIKKERFPRIFKTRTIIKDGSEYFGPYASVKIMNTILDLIRKTYKLRTCSYNLSQENISEGKFKRCLEYHIGNCKAPCEGLQLAEEYHQHIDEIKKIIKGDVNDVKKRLLSDLKNASKELEFERAAELQQKIEAIEKFQAKSTVVNSSINNVDVFSLISEKDLSYVNYMKVNNGAIIQAHTLEIKQKLDETPSELLEMAIIELRSRFNSQSKEVLVPFLPTFEIEGVKFHAPLRGDKKSLLELSERNAKYFMMERRKQEVKKDPERHTNRILEGLQKDLRLPDFPDHIECFDNSNIQGTSPASACVVFKNAKPSKKDYRHYNIKSVDGPDDFASMEEVVHRRYKRLLEEGEPLPKLVIIDGGKGQLSSALKSLELLGLRGKIPIVGIAKRLEEIYYPGDKYPLYIDKKSESLKLIQHLRNEAHRFSLKHHRNRRSNAGIKSELEQIPGIGESSIKELFENFKSVKRIKEASLEELKVVLSPDRAKKVYDYFN